MRQSNFFLDLFFKDDEVNKNLSFVKNPSWKNINFYRKLFWQPLQTRKIPVFINAKMVDAPGDLFLVPDHFKNKAH
jgi:hypothetical protein